ncbi:MAG: ATP-binding cassette domain-containing protein [Euryarchaeota archaeon]|nr:ATP-binding cassette domain-containing protein [Euryarchaeota archaeon]
MIEIKNLSRNWKEFSLNIDLHIKEKEYFVILGPTASGKTLLLELISGFYHPDSGNITIDKTDVSNLLPEQRKIGFVYQDYSLFPHLNVEENIEFGLKLKKTHHDERRRRVQEIMDILGISHLSHRYSLTLSGGEQQRVALARAIVVDPAILLLDEPLSALDNQTQNMLRDELKRIHHDAGLTTIHVTHDQTEAAMLADRIAVMIRGRIVQTGTPEEIFNSPANAEIAEFVGTENILEGIIVSNEGGLATIEVGVHVVEAVSGYSAGEHVRVCLRPEDVFVSVGAVASEIERGDRDRRESSVRNAFHGTVTQTIPYGALTRVKIDCGVVVIALITKQSAAAMGINAGSPVCVSFKAAAVHVIR